MTICVSGLTSAVAETADYENTCCHFGRGCVCLSSLQMHFSVACVARGLTVTEPTFWRVVAARVRDAMVAWKIVATRVRSERVSETQMLVTICFKFGGSRGSNDVRSPLIFEHCTSPDGWWKRSSMVRFGVLSAPGQIPTTWYDCGLQPSAGTKVAVMGKGVGYSFDCYTVIPS